MKLLNIYYEFMKVSSLSWPEYPVPRREHVRLLPISVYLINECFREASFLAPVPLATSDISSEMVKRLTKEDRMTEYLNS